METFYKENTESCSCLINETPFQTVALMLGDIISICLRKITKNKMTMLMGSTALKILACFVVISNQLHLVLISLNNLDR